MNLTSELWACEDRKFRAFAEQYAAIKRDVKSEIPPRNILSLDNGAARIDIKGVLLKQHDAVAQWWGIDNTGYDEIEAAIKGAIELSATQINLSIDSPGGMAQGVEGAANAIYEARNSATITAHVEGMAASAAYWLASAATSIEAPRDAIVGSIGTFSVMYDTSQMADKMGVKTIVVRYGDNKGAGVFGAEISEGQIAVEQNVVDTFGKMFVDGIARNRDGKKNFKSAENIATGAYWLATEGQKLGLVDDVLDDTKTTKAIRDTANQRRLQLMEAEIKAAVDAAITETETRIRAEMISGLSALEAAFPDHPEFARKAWESGKSLTDAKAEHYEIVTAELAATKAALASKPTEIAPPVAAQPVQTAPVSDTPKSYLELVAEYKSEKKCTQAQAIKHIQETNPEAYREYARK